MVSFEDLGEKSEMGDERMRENERRGEEKMNENEKLGFKKTLFTPLQRVAPRRVSAYRRGARNLSVIFRKFGLDRRGGHSSRAAALSPCPAQQCFVFTQRRGGQVSTAAALSTGQQQFQLLKFFFFYLQNTKK